MITLSLAAFAVWTVLNIPETIAQPAELHIGFFFPSFPLYPVPVQDFKPNLQSKTFYCMIYST